MAIYVIGDVQGCFDELMTLVDKLAFSPQNDQLWFVGDLVNRGPKSLETLRWVRQLGNAAITVLGNHDLHLLATYTGIEPIDQSSSLYPVLQANDVGELIDWLRYRPLVHYNQKLNIAILHAGLFPQWNIKETLSNADEVETVLRSRQYKNFLENMYGNQPDHWENSLSGWSRLRAITNCLTRMRYCNEEGVMSFSDKGPPGAQPSGMKPWYEINSRKSQDTMIVFGHWSALGYLADHNVIATDTGCLWGGYLTAVKIDSPERTVFQVKCEAKKAIPTIS